jgi:hypothetical protein
VTRAVPTPKDKEQEFRKHYLVTGNVAGSARAVGLPVSTGYDLRNRAVKDRHFIKARDALRAKLEPEAEQMAMCAMQLCMERLNVDPLEMLQKLDALAKPRGRSKTATKVSSRVTFQDPGPQYAASFAKLYQALIQAKRYESDRNGETQPVGTVTIKVSGPASAKLGDDGA